MEGDITMKVINAIWEKRNLNVDVQEVSFEMRDSIDELKEILSGINVPYSVVRIPSGRVDLLLEAQNLGYKVIEVNFLLEGDVRTMELPSIYKRFEPVISVHDADMAMRDRVLKEIRKGEIFATDRIALDPLFSQRIAGERYYNWVNDELDRGARMAIAYFKDKPAAFGINFAATGKGKIYDAFLGGLLSEAANKGLGFLLLYVNMESVRAQGGDKIIARVSSNNQPVFRLHMQYMYEIRETNYILVRHQ